MTSQTAPISIDDPVNLAILRISEDRLSGFQRDPFGAIAEQSNVALETVLERVRAMLDSGTIRRVRQTLISTKLAAGALIAWAVPEDRLSQAFDYMFERDPFSGHVVIRSTDPGTAGSRYRLWTTLKTPQGYSLQKHARFLSEQCGASDFRIMPAHKLFALGVGHMRRRGLPPGSRSDEPGAVLDTEVVSLSRKEWQVLTALKREFEVSEIQQDVWSQRAAEARTSLGEFCSVAEDLDQRGLVGRFSTFLDHVKTLPDGNRVTRYNALFHWAVPPGRELDAGREVGRHYIMTHAYWREGGPEFNDVNVMGVAHGTEKDAVLAHKAAIDEHLAEANIKVSYTNVFWGGRSEIKPSEISPVAYEAWCVENGIDAATMRDPA